MKRQAAIAAKEIRSRLKQAGIGALVKSRNFAGGDAIDVSLADKSPEVVAKAQAICAPFQYGHFDGMDDSYKYSNTRTDVLAQVKYLHIDTWRLE